MISTWPIEGVAKSIVVVTMEECQADVSRAVLRLPEHQGGDVAPELKGCFHSQLHLVLGQVPRPVHNPVAEVPFVPLSTCERKEMLQRGC